MKPQNPEVGGLIERVSRELKKTDSLNKVDNLPRISSHIDAFLDSCIMAMFPPDGTSSSQTNHSLDESSPKVAPKRDELLARAHSLLTTILSSSGLGERALSVSDSFLLEVPSIYKALLTDAEAAYLGDPACQSVSEAVLCYPGFYAVAVYRIAHALFTLQAGIVPRLMTECAHQKTGIDIHPGATIGNYFFIDHGTGVVIGETTTIGDHVTIYQNVTLGAKNFSLGPDGTPVKGIKRHPNVGDNVVIYSGATILGGDTTIGNGSVIGANVWLVHSVEPGSLIKRGNA